MICKLQYWRLLKSRNLVYEQVTSNILFYAVFSRGQMFFSVSEVNLLNHNRTSFLLWRDDSKRPSLNQLKQYILYFCVNLSDDRPLSTLDRSKAFCFLLLSAPDCWDLFHFIQNIGMSSSAAKLAHESIIKISKRRFDPAKSV